MAPAIPSHFHPLYLNLEKLISPAKKESTFKTNNYIATPYSICLPTMTCSIPELTIVSTSIF